EEDLTAEALVPCDRAHEALGSLQQAGDVLKGDGRREHLAGRIVPRHRLRLVLRERAEIKGRALIELAEAAPENPTALREHRNRYAAARREVHLLHDVVAVHAETQLEHHAIVEPPAVLSEERELQAGDVGMRDDRAVGGALRQGPIESPHVQLLTEVVAVVARI